MLLTEKIEEILTPIANDYDMDIVQVNYAKKNLQILLEKKDGSSPTIDECEEASRAFSATLDVEDLINEKYMLEVGSAGMDRPLTKLTDFEKFIGRDIKVELKMPRNLEDERKRFKGKIASLKNQTISLDTFLDDKNQIIEFEFDNIAKAKLLITDEMIKEILKNNKKNNKNK